jgi:hypothetical protein
MKILVSILLAPSQDLSFGLPIAGMVFSVIVGPRLARPQEV